MAGTSQAVEFISHSEAIVEIARLAEAQSEAFRSQAMQASALNDETRKLLAEFRAEVKEAGTELRKETLGYKATVDEQIASLRKKLVWRSPRSRSSPHSSNRLTFYWSRPCSTAQPQRRRQLQHKRGHRLGVAENGWQKA